MTTASTYVNTAIREKGVYTLPDPPPRHPDDMTSFDHLTATGSAHHLLMHLGSPDTTLVAGERYVVLRPTRSMAGSHYPDMLVAFDVDPWLYKANNGYIISEQGKPPDFVLEIASPKTGHVDVGEKRDAYAELGIAEYWRFDETGDHHGSRLGGDRLAGNRYSAIEIVEIEVGVLQGYSEVLDLHIRWEHGVLGWYDPATGEHIPTFESERARADDQRLRADALEAEVRRLRGMAGDFDPNQD